MGRKDIRIAMVEVDEYDAVVICDGGRVQDIIVRNDLGNVLVIDYDKNLGEADINATINGTRAHVSEWKPIRDPELIQELAGQYSLGCQNKHDHEDDVRSDRVELSTEEDQRLDQDGRPGPDQSWNVELTLSGGGPDSMIHLPGMWANWRRAARIGDDDFLGSFAASYGIPWGEQDLILSILFAPHQSDSENNKVYLIVQRDVADRFRDYREQMSD